MQNKTLFENQQLQMMQIQYQHLLALNMDESAIVRRVLSGVVHCVVIRNAPQVQAIGTNVTASCVNSNNMIASQVATSLAFCVDTVVNRVEREGWISTTVIDDMKGEAYPPFKMDDPSKTVWF